MKALFRMTLLPFPSALHQPCYSSSWSHRTSTFLLYLTSTNFLPLPVIVSMFRLPVLTPQFLSSFWANGHAFLISLVAHFPFAACRLTGLMGVVVDLACTGPIWPRFYTGCPRWCPPLAFSGILDQHKEATDWCPLVAGLCGPLSLC